jgi:hypothetical protein
VAESLDRSHAQVISGLELRDRGDDMLLQIHSASDAELELWAALRHTEPFERLVRKPVHFEVAPAVKAPVADSPAKPAPRTGRARAALVRA